MAHPALYSTLGVERAAVLTTIVHRPREPVRDDGADDQNANERRKADDGLKHLFASFLWLARLASPVACPDRALVQHGNRRAANHSVKRRWFIKHGDV